MAISGVHFQLLRELSKKLDVPERCRVLEIGEANHYGDWNPDLLEEDISRISDRERRQALLDVLAMYRKAIDGKETMQWQICKFCYQVLFYAAEVWSIDLHGTEAAIRCDLNLAAFENSGIPGGDIIYNHGTAEHIFNIANVFRFMHDATKVGGYMIHESPCTGWLDHGFYSLQPTLFYDLAAANGYEIVLAALEQIRPAKIIPIEYRERIGELAMMGAIPPNAMLYVCFRKQTSAPFQNPMQGVYAGTVSEDVTRAWRTLR